MFHNYSAIAGISANASILPPARLETEIEKGFLNGGRGACWIDYDGDGDDDLYVVGYGSNQFFRHDGGWSFTEISNASGLGVQGYGMACGAADLDRDGDQDIWATSYDAGDRIFRNSGNGTFTDVTAASGVTDRQGHTGASFGDFDNDGLLDVFVASYNRQQDLLYRNLGNLSFEERWESSRTYDLDWGFQSLIFDYDLDGDVDIYVINDFGLDRMWRNDGNWSFYDVSNQIGANDGGGGMGGDVADVDHDGDLDFYVANYAQNGLWIWNGSGYENKAAEAGVDNSSVAWASIFFDYDNDAWEDLYVVNGAVDSHSERFQSDVLYRNLGGLRFEDVSAGSGAASVEIGRSAAVADVDGDGRLDIYMTNVNSPNEMLRNVVNTTNRWLGVQLEGTVSNTDGVGALVTVRAGNLTHVRPMMVGTGYLSTGSKVMHFGLGDRDTVDSVEVKWPSGLVQTVRSVGVNATTYIQEQDRSAPVAVAGDVTALRGVPFPLNGTASTDNVRIVAWNWTVDQNGTLRSAYGKVSALAIYTAGNYTGQLEVRDLFGNANTTSFRVDVAPFSGVWADAGPDIRVDEGVEHRFVAGGGTSETPDYEGTSLFAWSFTEWGVPTTLSGARPNHTFTQVGTIEVRLHVTDVASQTAVDFVNVTVADVTAPVIVASLPPEVDEDVSVALDGTLSSDNDPLFPAGASAEWSYLGPAGSISAYGLYANIVFAEPGQVTLTLRVTDAAGNSASRVFPLLVRDRTRPEAVAGPDRLVGPGEPVVLSAAASTDNAGDFFENGVFTWTVDTPQGTQTLVGPTHTITFSSPGVYLVRLDAVDPSGNPASAPDSFTVTVRDDEPPTAKGGGNRFVGVGEIVALDASNSTDNDPAFLDTGTFVWEFQDGSANLRITGKAVTYTFRAPGEYRVRLSATDAAGNAAAVLFTLTVGDASPPSIQAETPPSQVVQGTAVSLNASATSDNLALASVSWHVTGPFAFDVTLSGASGVIELGLPGVYNATVTAVDAAGNRASQSFEIKVVPRTSGGNGGGGNPPPAGNGTGSPGDPAASGGVAMAAVAIGAAAAAAAALFVFQRRRGAKPPQAG